MLSKSRAFKKINEIGGREKIAQELAVCFSRYGNILDSIEMILSKQLVALFDMSFDTVGRQ